MSDPEYTPHKWDKHAKRFAKLNAAFSVVTLLMAGLIIILYFSAR